MDAPIGERVAEREDNTASFVVAGRYGRPGLLGRLLSAGRVEGGRGVPAGVRRIPSYAVMLVYAGTGVYRDQAGEASLGPGSLVSVLPGHPHWYGVVGDGRWSEVYLTFEGHAFDAARDGGLLDPRRPVATVSPVAHWRNRLDGFRSRRPPSTPSGADREVCDVLALLVDAFSPESVPTRAAGWLAASQERLAADLTEPLDLSEVAAAVGMGYESWRKRFREETGMSPGRFRTARRVDAAAEALRRSTLSHREIAASLGFTDAQHLAKQFRAWRGMSPTQYRLRN